MTTSLDLANWFGNVADKVREKHKSLLAARPVDGSPDLPAWEAELITLTHQFSSLNAARMTLANLDAEQVLEGLGPRLGAVAEATQRARDTISRIEDINRSLALVAAVVTVAAAIPAAIANPVAGAVALFKAGDALAKALKDDGGKTKPAKPKTPKAKPAKPKP